MTWKSTAAASGLMLVGTWLASYAPVGGPRPDLSAVPSAARTEAAAAEIQREADRLHDRLQQAAAYRPPARNPFQFAAPRARAIAPPPPVSFEPAPVVEEPPTPRLMLSGIAEDSVGEGEAQSVVRTAIISSPEDVHLVKIGDTISGLYKVVGITPTAVDLERLDNGLPVRLVLKQ